MWLLLQQLQISEMFFVYLFSNDLVSIHIVQIYSNFS